MRCTIGHSSGGIRIRSEQVGMDAWLTRLLTTLQAEAAHSEQTAPGAREHRDRRAIVTEQTAHRSRSRRSQPVAQDLPKDAAHRLEELEHGLFTSDLSVNEFLLIKEAGFHPLGFVMGSSIYHIGIQTRKWGKSQELTKLTEAMYNARELAMTRMEEEADELGADGVVGVRLDVNYYEWGNDAAEFIAFGTAVKAEDGTSYRNALGKPFTSDLSGQDFWTIMQTGHVPQGLVMGTCVFHIAHRRLTQALGSMGQNVELPNFTQALYEARELAMTRMQDEADRLGASGIVGVRLEEKSHQWGSHTIEFLALGTAVTKAQRRRHAAQAHHHHLPRQLMQRDGPTGRPLPRRPSAAWSPTAFSSGLTVPDFAACLEMGLRPVGLVQGFCVMQWGWYGPVGVHARHVALRRRRSRPAGSYSETYRCPHGFVSNEHRTWGQNFEQPWVEAAWAQGYGSAYTRMLEEAGTLGAHGVIGVVDRVSNVADTGRPSSTSWAPRWSSRAGRRRRRACRGPRTWRASAWPSRRGRVHAGGGGGGAGLGAGVGLLHDRVLHGGHHGLGGAVGARSSSSR